MPSRRTLGSPSSAVLVAALILAVTSHSTPSEHTDVVQRYVVDNSQLHSKLGWLSYRQSMDLSDFVKKDGHVKPGELWGSVVEGVSQGDKWVKVGERYLPKNIRGFPVLSLEAELASRALKAYVGKAEDPHPPLATLATNTDERAKTSDVASGAAREEQTERKEGDASAGEQQATHEKVDQGAETQHAEQKEADGGDAGRREVRPHKESVSPSSDVAATASGADGVAKAADGPPSASLSPDAPAVLAGAGSVAKPPVAIAAAEDAARVAGTPEDASAGAPRAPVPAEGETTTPTDPDTSSRQDPTSKSTAEKAALARRPKAERFMQSGSPRAASDAAVQDEAMPAQEERPPPPPPVDDSEQELMRVPETDVFGDKPRPGTRDALGILSALSTLTLWASLSVMVSFFYYYEKAHPPRLDPEGVKVQLHERERLDKRRWRFGLFECGGDTAVCMSSFLCAPVRWADTMRMAGLLQFFAAVALVWFLVLVGFVALHLGFVVLLACLVHYRQRIRLMFDIPNGSFQTVVEDVAAYLCCCPCAVAQEARQLEEAYLARHPAVHRPGGRVLRKE